MADAIRAVLAFIATGIILVLLAQLPVSSWSLLLIALVIVVACIATAKSRLGVVLAVIVILASRLIIAFPLGILRHCRVK